MSVHPPSSDPSEPSDRPHERPIEPSAEFRVPPGFGTPPPPSGDEFGYDPLVPPPYDGLRPLWERLTDTLRRSGAMVAGLLLLTIAVPQIAQAVIVQATLEGVASAGPPGLLLPDDQDAQPWEFGAVSAGLFVWLVVIYLTLTIIAAIGWGAGIWAVTEAAADRPVAMGPALQAGFRRMLPMFGWYVLFTAMFAIGLILCILPGLYLAVAGCLFSFVVIFERGRNPMGRSFSLVHKSFGAVLGRVGLLALFMLGVYCVVGLCVGGLAIGGGEVSATASLVGDVVSALVGVPVYTVLLVGLLLTYTQVRARQEPVSTASLWAAANQDSLGGPPGYISPVQPG